MEQMRRDVRRDTDDVRRDTDGEHNRARGASVGACHVMPMARPRSFGEDLSPGMQRTTGLSVYEHALAAAGAGGPVLRPRAAHHGPRRHAGQPGPRPGSARGPRDPRGSRPCIARRDRREAR